MNWKKATRSFVVNLEILHDCNAGCITKLRIKTEISTGNLVADQAVHELRQGILRQDTAFDGSTFDDIETDNIPFTEDTAKKLQRFHPERPLGQPYRLPE